MTEKERFVTLAHSGRFTITELCSDFGISRKTGHNTYNATRAGACGSAGSKPFSPAGRAVQMSYRAPGTFEGEAGPWMKMFQNARSYVG